ncbi:MAG: type II toxin-antitoxin system RelE family toxin [Egibacteraceae bacterium]
MAGCGCAWGDYRVLYDVDDVAGQVLIRKVGHRRQVYDR